MAERRWKVEVVQDGHHRDQVERFTDLFEWHPADRDGRLTGESPCRHLRHRLIDVHAVNLLEARRQRRDELTAAAPDIQRTTALVRQVSQEPAM